MILDVHELLSRYFPSESNLTIEQFESLDICITSLILPNWSCNDVDYIFFDLSRFILLESIEIGNDGFGSIETFMINDLHKLRSLKIGSNSFTQVKYDNIVLGVKSTLNIECNESKSFHILNCESLESIEIGIYSFLDFGGEFELHNLKSLKSIKIGSFETISCCFVWSSFIIRSILYHYIYTN